MATATHRAGRTEHAAVGWVPAFGPLPSRYLSAAVFGRERFTGPSKTVLLDHRDHAVFPEDFLPLFNGLGALRWKARRNRVLQIVSKNEGPVAPQCISQIHVSVLVATQH